MSKDDLEFEWHPPDSSAPKSIACPHCHGEIKAPDKVPYSVIDGELGGPESVELLCPHCGRAVDIPLYVPPPTIQ
jgi:hypothetical protein